METTRAFSTANRIGSVVDERFLLEMGFIITGQKKTGCNYEIIFCIYKKEGIDMGAEEKKVKHLEFVQSNIARMNQCSFQMKGWMITVVSAMLALYAASISSESGSGNNMFIYTAVVPTILFWYLDSYYLKQERKFRGVYNDLIGISSRVEVKEFEMPLEKYVGCEYCVLRVMFSKSEGPLYCLMIIGLLIAGTYL